MKLKCLIFVKQLLFVSSINCFLKAKGEATVRDEHLLTIGNDERGNSILTVTSKLGASNSIFSLDSRPLSSACGTHPSRCREVAIESELLTNLTSQHTVFIPLDNGLHLLQLLYSGSSRELRLHSQHTLIFSGISNCSSLTPQKIGSVHYIVCISRDSLYVCSLNINLTMIEQSTIQRCQPMPFSTRIDGYTTLSNIILSSDHSVLRQHILFLLNNILFRLFPITNSLSFVNFFSDSECTSASQLLLQSPKVESELLIYCRDRSSIVYDTNIDQIVSHAQLDNVLYPCSQRAEFIVHLTQTMMDFSYKVSTDGSDIVKIFVSQTASSDFYSGVCFDFGNHQLFTFLDKRNGVFLFNTTSENVTSLQGIQGCGVEDCELLLKYSSRYLIVRNKEQRKVTVYDVIDAQVIVTVENVNFSLVGLIYNLQAVNISSTTTSPTGISIVTSISSPPGTKDQPMHLSGGIIAIIVIVTLIIVVIVSVAMTMTIVFGLPKIRRRQTPIDDVNMNRLENVPTSPTEEESLREQLHVEETTIRHLQSTPGEDQDTQEVQEVPHTSMNISSPPIANKEVANASECCTHNSTELAIDVAKTTSVPETMDSDKEDTVKTGDTDETNEKTTESKNKEDILLVDHTNKSDSSTYSDTDDPCDSAASVQHTQSEDWPPDNKQLTSEHKATKPKHSMDSNHEHPKLEKTDSLYPFRIHFMKTTNEENDTSSASDCPKDDSQSSHLTHL